jgi:ribosomal protein S18 acetylase RimI-like enzyme
MDIEYRKVAESELDEFRRIRLLALRESPTAFGSSFEESSVHPDEYFTGLIKVEDSDGMLCGAWDGNHLCGVGGLRRDGRLKQRHRASIWGMYVEPDRRGKRVGHAILDRLLAKARAIPELAIIMLTVEASNAPALRLYSQFGFVKVGTEPMALRVDGRYWDLDQMALHLGGGAHPAGNVP